MIVLPWLDLALVWLRFLLFSFLLLFQFLLFLLPQFSFLFLLLLQLLPFLLPQFSFLLMLLLQGLLLLLLEFSFLFLLLIQLLLLLLLKYSFLFLFLPQLMLLLLLQYSFLFLLLIHLLLLIEMMWAEADAPERGRGVPKTYNEKTMFKVYLVSLVKQLWERRGLWRYLKANPVVMEACGLVRVPNRRTLDRRLVEIAPHAEAQIRALGLVLSVEQVTNSATAAVICMGVVVLTVVLFFVIPRGSRK